MVIKGSARGGARQLAQHLARTDTNESARVVDMRDVAAADLRGALCEMDALGAALRTSRTLYHASINTRADEAMTPEQWAQSVDRLEAALGLTGQPRVIVAHRKEGREHVHIVWARTDLEHMRAIRADHNYRKHEDVARELEREFGHARVQGAHAEREGVERPERTPSHAEQQQAARSGITPQEAKAQLTEIWNRTDSGKAFAAAIAEQGWILARGDKRDLVVLDQAGEVHSLARRIEGVKVKDVRERMADVDAASLPSADEAKAMQRDRAAGQKPTSDQIQWEDELAAAAITKARGEVVGIPAPTPVATITTPEPRVAAATTDGGMMAQEREALRLARDRAEREAKMRQQQEKEERIRQLAEEARRALERSRGRGRSR